ncbi:MULTISPECIES: OmpW/AlkL family protein [Kordiimonas]|uniref:Outer membrane protein n=1 Tax=Kordiimonas lacus TaxID=637679 RepID=A0A1G6ZG95_9PROT|nr:MULTISPECIES: OmpW family outer membrane protein [Kordiimonas]SDE01267.1 outer membrane protein [Kordiimonas lacus]
MRISNFVKLLTCAAALQLGAGAAMADDTKSPWQVRVRLIDVVPDESSTTSIGGQANVDNSLVPELDISYYWTKNWSTELILATSKHNVTATGTALGDLSLGDTWALPPTMLMQYHFNADGTMRPYLGAGVNYTFFYNADAGDVDSIDYENGFGLALQAGVDIDVTDEWFLNLDVKKLWLNTDVSINGGAVTADVDLDPWVLGVGFGYRF